MSVLQPPPVPDPGGFPRRWRSALVELIGLGLVVLGFVIAAAAPWHAKASGVLTVLLGVDVIQYPTRRDRIRVYWWRRDRPRSPDPPDQDASPL